MKIMLRIIIVLLAAAGALFSAAALTESNNPRYITLNTLEEE